MCLALTVIHPYILIVRKDILNNLGRESKLLEQIERICVRIVIWKTHGADVVVVMFAFGVLRSELVRESPTTGARARLEDRIRDTPLFQKHGDTQTRNTGADDSYTLERRDAYVGHIVVGA